MKRGTFRGSFVTLFTLLVISISLAGPIDSWQQRNPAPPPVSFSGVAYGNGIYVAVGGYNTGNRGLLMTSTDGTSWTSRDVNVSGWPTNRPLYSAAFGNGRFVIGGYSGLLMTSEDGLNWTQRYALSGIDYTSIAYCGDRFLATGFTGYMVVSTNGIDWAEVHPGVSASFQGMCFGSGGYLAVGSGGTIILSSNAADWVAQSSGVTNRLFGVTFAQNMYVAVGGQGRILTSLDATNWASRSSGTTQDLYSVTFGGGKFVAAGDTGKLSYSSNGIDWSLSPSSGLDGKFGPAYLGSYSSAVHGGNQFIAVGPDSGSGGNVAVSEDGTIWRSLFGFLGGVACGDSGFVAVGELGCVRTSSNGSNWTNGTVGVGNHLRSVTFGVGKCVAVGDKGAVCISTNLTDWTTQTVGSNQLNVVAFGNGVFVAAGESATIVYSTNGSVWQFPTQSFFAAGFRVACHGDAGFVVSGSAYGMVYLSTDGQEWTSASLPGNYFLMSGAYGKGTYVLVGQSSRIVTSSDGTNWVSRTVPGGSNISFSGVTYINGVFVAVAYDASVFFSSDGKQWVRGNMGIVMPKMSDAILGLTHDLGTLVAVGTQGGRIMQSGEVFSLGAGCWLLSVGQKLNLAGRMGTAFRIQKSPDLASWDDLLWVTNTAGEVNFLDPSATNAQSRFYRAAFP